MEAEKEAKKKAEQEVIESEEVLEPQVTESEIVEELLIRTFKVEATKAQLLELGDFMKSKGIKFWLMTNAKGEK